MPTAGDSYRPSYRPSNGSSRSRNNADEPFPAPPSELAETMYQFKGSPSGRGGFSFRPRVSKRDLLTHKIPKSERSFLSSSADTHKFRNVENLTDSDEAAMEEDSTDGDENIPTKRRRLDIDDSAVSTKPQWSNPDPYTALPPPPESTGKRVNVVKLIRKARNEPENAEKMVAEQNDFISFDSADDTDFAPPANAPSGPRALTTPNADANPNLDPARGPLGKRKRGDDQDRLMGNPNRVQFHASAAVLAEWRPADDICPSPWRQPSIPGDSAIVALHKEVLDFYDWVRPQEFEFIVREELVARLERELRRFRPGQLRSFGSYAAGLYLPTGDMDLVYFLGGTIRNLPPLERKTMFQIGDFIERSGVARMKSVKVIWKAKVPIIKFVDDKTGLKIDLSFNNTTGVVAIETFKKWQATYPAIPVLVALIKQFLMIRGLNDNAVGGFGGFAIICLVTSLVQNLPSNKQQNLGELLIEFFNLYGNLLDMKNIAIRLDPPGYVSRSKYRPLNDEKDNRLVIIDPNRADNNITGGSTEALRILKLFSRTYGELMTKLDNFAARSEDEKSSSLLVDLVGGNFTSYNKQRQTLHSVYRQSHGGSGASSVPPPPMMVKLVTTTPDIPPPPPPMLAPDHTPPPPPSSPPPRRTSKDKSINGVHKSDGRVHLIENNHSLIADHRQDGADSQTSQNSSEDFQKKSQRRLTRLKKLCPELIPKLGIRQMITVDEAVNIGKWKSKQEMGKDLDFREQSQKKKG